MQIWANTRHTFSSAVAFGSEEPRANLALSMVSICLTSADGLHFTIFSGDWGSGSRCLMSPGFLGHLFPRRSACRLSNLRRSGQKRQHFCRNCVALIILNRQEDGLQEIVEGGT